MKQSHDVELEKIKKQEELNKKVKMVTGAEMKKKVIFVSITFNCYITLLEGRGIVGFVMKRYGKMEGDRV